MRQRGVCDEGGSKLSFERSGMHPPLFPFPGDPQRPRAACTLHLLQLRGALHPFNPLKVAFVLSGLNFTETFSLTLFPVTKGNDDRDASFSWKENNVISNKISALF